MKLNIQTLDAKAAGSIDLDDAIFGIKEVRADILQRMVKYQLAKRRAGTHKTQSRGEVSVTHSKLYKQKGTGQARHGAKNAPIFRGGGHAHNRLPRDYTHDLTKKFRALALRHALSAKANAGDIVVIDALTVKDGKTSALKKSLSNLKLEKALFIAGAEVDAGVARAARNIPYIDVLPNAGLNVYDILRAEKLVLTQDAVNAIHERFKDKAGKAEAAPKNRAAKKTEAEGAAA
ncbi:50S ribosomal protein L4 [Candidatus Viadribacter manganicus]|uniref:Large ribosomal subunit protein uL4 n=1 Tax=Candidatus Viadribacter manganicus TaxID=1759059 RepID=A0A1B1AMK4_9PROT|nr:50S ribosomal protein L4 [Candidatus Viadribacter manganicus]ANP47808.1 50S ribosomal protein L4 [Candidatus Viadribacter manganicus]